MAKTTATTSKCGMSHATKINEKKGKKTCTRAHLNGDQTL